MKLLNYSTLLCLVIILPGCNANKKFKVNSPDGNISFTVSASTAADPNSVAVFSLSAWKRKILESSPLRIVADYPDLSGGFKIVRTEYESVRSIWTNFFGERKEIPDNYNQIKLFLESGEKKLNLICRVYDEGAAFAWELPEQQGMESVTITDESITFRFPADYMAWSAPRAQAQYSHVPLSRIDKGCERPLVIEYDTNLVVALAEAKLVDFARMKFEPDSTVGTAVRTRLGSNVHKTLPFQSPWRVMMVGKNPGDLLEKNYLILNLNDPCEIADVSWITPGKALREVTLTTAGAKACIDYTSAHNMQYVEFDAGWYGPENSEESDATTVTIDPARSKGPLDLPEVIRYANSKNIKILLYVNRRALEKQLDELLPLYREWGIAGIKFGFVQVGTQDATRWLHESIIKTADYRMVVDVHDEYRTTGFSRTWPSFLTMEGIRGDEESPTNSHTLITMFTRMLAGQGDNTICYFNERVQNKMGSHASQLAKAVCIFSPLQFLYWYDRVASSPDKKDGLWGTTNYIGDEPELEFFDNVPTVWDETKVLHARIGEYGVIARRKGDEWFIGGINGEQARTLEINMSFLDPDTRYTASVYSDDPSVDTRTHVRIDRLKIGRDFVFTTNLDSNNGIALHIVPD
ncbi:MAG: glycoside hydrolase family 97 N-terminal domain-containing protein [Bacteroidales bacterium]